MQGMALKFKIFRGTTTPEHPYTYLAPSALASNNSTSFELSFRPTLYCIWELYGFVTITTLKTQYVRHIELYF